MITVGKIADRIGFDNGNLVYLGNKSGITQTELDENNGVFFDTNNINKFVTINNNDNKVKETDESFINNAKFYTCSENGQTYLCFRCVNNCDTNCHSCDICVGCNGCVGCHGCVDCNDCLQCVKCANCTVCVTCHGCQNCNDYSCGNCTSCDGCTSCASCTSGEQSCIKSICGNGTSNTTACPGSCYGCTGNTGGTCTTCNSCDGCNGGCQYCTGCNRCASCIENCYTPY